MKINPDKLYMMPLIMGHYADKENPPSYHNNRGASAGSGHRSLQRGPQVNRRIVHINNIKDRGEVSPGAVHPTKHIDLPPYCSNGMSYPASRHWRVNRPCVGRRIVGLISITAGTRTVDGISTEHIDLPVHYSSRGSCSLGGHWCKIAPRLGSRIIDF